MTDDILCLLNPIWILQTKMNSNNNLSFCYDGDLNLTADLMHRCRGFLIFDCRKHLGKNFLYSPNSNILVEPDLWFDIVLVKFN